MNSVEVMRRGKIKSEGSDEIGGLKRTKEKDGEKIVKKLSDLKMDKSDFFDEFEK
jgi:hypothetical protein